MTSKMSLGARPQAQPLENADLVRHLKQKALARRWDISTRTLERWRVAGTGPRYLKLNGRVIYRLDDILSFEEVRLRDRTDNQSSNDNRGA